MRVSPVLSTGDARRRKVPAQPLDHGPLRGGRGGCRGYDGRRHGNRRRRHVGHACPHRGVPRLGCRGIRREELGLFGRWRWDPIERHLSRCHGAVAIDVHPHAVGLNVGTDFLVVAWERDLDRLFELAANAAFQNFDQKSNQLYNLMASVMKAMNEMRGGTIRNML